MTLVTRPSIVTLTLNPALDISTAVESMIPNHKLRGDAPSVEPGGGGINVARVVSRLGLDVEAIVLLGGSTGTRLGELLAAEGIDATVVDLDGETRESITIFEKSTEQLFRLVLPGPTIDAAALDRCRAALADSAPMNCLVVSGSVPPGAPEGMLEALIASVGPSTTVLVDTSGPALGEAIAAGARLVKPSARELSGLVGRELVTELEVAQGAREVLAGSSTEALIVSIGAGGAFVITHDEPPIRFRAPTVRVKSSVGAGDSMVAGIAVGLQRGLGLLDAVAFGVASGTAAVLTDGSQLCDPAAIAELLPMVTYERT